MTNTDAPTPSASPHPGPESVAAVAVTWPEEADREPASLVPAVQSAAAELQRRLYGR